MSIAKARLFLKYTAGQERFVAERTRQKLVDWCEQSLADPSFAPGLVPAWAKGWPKTQEPYIEYATAKGWLGKKGQVTGAGWDTAARFLKR